MSKMLTAAMFGATLGIWCGLAMFVVGCGSGGGDDDPVLAAVPPPAPVNPGDCAVNIDGDFVVCLGGDCNNTIPVDEPVITEDTVPEDPIVEVGDGTTGYALVSGKVSGINVNIAFCSDTQQHQSESSSTVAQ